MLDPSEQGREGLEPPRNGMSFVKVLLPRYKSNPTNLLSILLSTYYSLLYSTTPYSLFSVSELKQQR
jgi:hypothetical protein